MTVTIRLATPADAPGCLAIYAPYVAETAVSFETEVPEPAAFADRMAATLALTPWVVAEHRGRIAGYVYATLYRQRRAYQWSVETTVYVAADYRGRGLARVLYAALLDCLRRQGYRNAYAVITLPNPASVRLHEALGFGPIGVFAGTGHKLGRWHDVGWWHLRLGELDERPAPPVPLPGLTPPPRFDPWPLPPGR